MNCHFSAGPPETTERSSEFLFTALGFGLRLLGCKVEVFAFWVLESRILGVRLQVSGQDLGCSSSNFESTWDSCFRGP